MCDGSENDLHLPGKQIGHVIPAIRNVNHFGSGHELEQLGANMRRASDAIRGYVDLIGIAFEISSELRKGCGRKRWRYDDDERRFGNPCDRRDVADEIEIEIAIERYVHRVGRDRQQDGVAVGLGFRDVFGADIGAGARPVLNDELLAEPLRQMLGGKTPDDVGAAAGRVRYDQLHWSRRVGLRPGGMRERRR